MGAHEKGLIHLVVVAERVVRKVERQAKEGVAEKMDLRVEP